MCCREIIFNSGAFSDSLTARENARIYAILMDDFNAVGSGNAISEAKYLAIFTALPMINGAVVDVTIEASSDRARAIL